MPSLRPRQSAPARVRRRFLFLTSLLLVLVALPFIYRVGAGPQDRLDPEGALARKGDKLTRLVHRAARADRLRPRGGDEANSEVRKISRLAAVNRRNGETSVSLLVNVSERNADELKAAGFAVGSVAGGLATVETSVDRLPELAALNSVKSLEVATYAYPANNLARQAVKIDDAAGNRQVAQDGAGVVIGFVDSGIDFRHLDFTVPGSSGKLTRIKYLLDMTSYGGTGAPDPGWNYTLPGGTASIGRLYTEGELNSALSAPNNDTIVKQRDLVGHGTHVAATAAGNGLASNNPRRFEGIAPRADLIVVKANRENSSADPSFRSSDQVNALRFIEEKANELGRPFVINMSLGGHTGPHTGVNSNEREIDRIVNAGPGRAVCVASGNEGDEDIHAGGNLSTGSEVELQVQSPGGSPDYFEFYYAKADRFTVTITKPNGTTLGPYAYGTDLDTPDPDPAVDSVFNAIDTMGTDDVSDDLNDIFIVFNNVASARGAWKFRIRADSVQADGRFNVWLGAGRFDNDSDSTNTPPSYVDPSRRISSPGNSRGAITVGSFVTRLKSGDPFTAGQGADFTGQGPTADGRAKPEISAPGYYLFSARSSDGAITVPTQAGEPAYVGTSGTSMSTPVVTGAVALMFQANRNLNITQVKRFLTNYADNDSFALPGWDPRLGYGKLNVPATLNAVLGGANPIDETNPFVRRQYLDFLNREPEPDGFTSWSNVLNGCAPGNTACDRITVSSSFFLSPEFREKGYFAYRYYRVSFGRMPLYTEIIPDMRAVTGQTGDERIAKQNQFVSAWVTRPDFAAAYPAGLSAQAFVDKLEQGAAVALTNKAQLVADLQAGTRSRAQVVRAVVESPEVAAKYYNEAFVAMQYFGYLRRDPEPAGFNDWLRVINANPADARTMINGFMNSNEYRLRFGYVAGVQ